MKTCPGSSPWDSKYSGDQNEPSICLKSHIVGTLLRRIGQQRTEAQNCPCFPNLMNFRLRYLRSKLPTLNLI